ncbi:MAG: hypothetical protein K2O67_05965, partial [Clostridia bacterium]|nr:hypothetical protein [Clostridia bacterium]
MKLFKKILCVLAVLLLALSFAGCGEYVPPQNPGGDPTGPDTSVTPPGVDKPGDPETPVDEGFTVTLKYYERMVEESGQAYYVELPFTRSAYEGGSKSFNVRWKDLQVQWTDMETKEIYRSPLSDEGVAVRNDLDGDYAVTLVSLPDGFTYEPNSYVATNNSRQIEILLFRITPLPVPAVYKPTGEKYHMLNATGTYRITLNSREDKVLLGYKPDRQGVYSVTSMVDVTLNEVNPIIDVHKGNMPQYYNEKKFATQDGGGKENTFTKNFLWEYDISIDEVGGSFVFKIYSSCIKPDTVAYPMDVDIIIEREGEFPDRYPPSTEIVAKEDFSKTPPTPQGTFTYFVDRPGVRNNMLNEKMVKLKTEGEGSGYYYFYDAATDTYGDRLYAKITERCQVFFDIISSYRGLNYIQATPVSEPKFYVDFVAAYAENCNADGCYPVTEELKDFLFDFARHNRRELFNDGFGTAETDYGYN